MKEAYQVWNPSKSSADLLREINLILEDFERKGYLLTLRQLYYQLVVKDIIPNTVREYARIGNVVSRGRMAGFIDWANDRRQDKRECRQVALVGPERID